MDRDLSLPKYPPQLCATLLVKEVSLWDEGLLVSIGIASPVREQEEESFHQDQSAVAIDHLVTYTLPSSDLLLVY